MKKQKLPLYASGYGDYEKMVRFPVFNYSVEIVFTGSVSESHYYRTDEDSPDCHEGQYTELAGGGILYIQKEASYGTLAHECWHAVHHMLARVGAGLDEEVVAYHLGYLVDKVLEFRKELQILYPKEFKK